ncbi:hypothetical protein Pla108_00070 [Botrimarina colliarenosi]|uniref:DUF4340 domain-containing protein n=1 Tax=Botrimarina colliarenosi TaxID=2528001 RepID=A0A5C6AGH5_9BACT|nr:DUF4340 domain-containing protein [Botrimarina colliarenosi]TWT99074.1 hypothetical protein Pla108_00070 [Botrimarina colliarenosi]
MKESTQTLLFLAAAIGSVMAASWSRPTDVTYQVDDLIGQPLFASFESEEAKLMRIVRFDEETATLREFEVAEENGVWSIPSKGGYPADAERQMAEASTGVVDLEILAIASQSAADHAEFGVVEPSSSLEVGQTGVGARVTLESGGGETLVDVIVGKEVKDTENQRFVRKPTQDVVYVVAIDPSKFSTKFEDWIEDDLLKISAFDIARVEVKDYSAELVMQGFRPALALDPRADLTVDYDDQESKWSPHELKTYDRDTEQYVEFTLGEDEELNEETLRELKTAVDNLTIVDVERKPTGLSGDLKAGDDFFKDRSSIQSLMERGFAPTKTEAGDTEVLSSEGEVIVTQKDGVEYVLRFGKLQLSSEGDQPVKTADEAADDEAGNPGVNRYLFVMARFNDGMIETPELEEVPSEEVTEDASEEDAEEEASAEEADGEETKAEAAAREREAIVQRNQRNQDAYDDKVAAAKQRVEELNNRFGDWYYVISDEVYNKVAIDREELIKTKEPAEGDDDEPATAAPAGIPGLPNLSGFSNASDDDEAAAETDASEAAPMEEGADEGATGDGATGDGAADAPEAEAADTVEEATTPAVEAE